jgi:hypothetical protein
MTKTSGVLYIVVALTLWFGAMHLPSVLVVFLTHKKYSLLASGQYWLVSAGAALPSLVGLVLFVALYPVFKGPGEGAIAGLWFVIVGAIMMSVASARYVYRFPEVPEPSLWECVRFGLWPYLIVGGLAIVAMMVGLIMKLRHQ